MEDQNDLNAWLGKPPEKPVSEPPSEADANDPRSSDNAQSPAPSLSRSSSDVVEVSQSLKSQPHPTEVDDQPMAIEDDGTDELQIQDSEPKEVEFMVNKQDGLTIDPPELSEDERDQYEHLPGHFNVKRILYAIGDVPADRKFIVKLGTGEVDLVERSQLTTQFRNGKLALNAHQSATMRNRSLRSRQPPTLPSGVIDWNKIHVSDTEDEQPARKRRKHYVEQDVSDIDQQASSADDFADDQDEDDLRPQGRRSNRLAPKRRSNYFQNELSEIKDLLDSDEDVPRRRSGRPPKRQVTRQQNATQTSRASRAKRAISSEEREERSANARRSERTRTQPKRSMRERQEDELSSQSEKDLGPKVVATKEVFTKIPPSDPFRKRHQPDCATCYHTGDHEMKGPLVFCQGCSNAYHKTCLGPRGSREHLVTKVGDSLFVLQCRKCVGMAREKDPAAPHYGKCSGCDKMGPLSKPLRRRLTTRQEQIQREENGGSDPITITQPDTINNPDNVMFRCATCNQAWHLHHMPNRKTTNSGDSDEEGMSEQQIAQKRFDMYHRSWICKDCVENQQSVDTLVAWRPINQDSYVPGTTLDKMQESQKEYLVKWQKQSYLRCTWMPGTWIWGVVSGVSRNAFGKRSENQLPRMTTKDAIPEEYHRIDIVFDVRYTSVVRNSSEGIDLARAKEVDTAFVKFKGLGYEDAIWEKPPVYADRERFLDFKEAYDDYVRKKYMSIPPQSTLRRTLEKVRQMDFETKHIRKAQPTNMTGGQVMQYQLEGLNWLYYQWYRQFNAILADEMGLGKTIQLIALMGTLVQEHKCWPFLVVVPNSTCPNWRREIQKWAPSLRAVCYYGSRDARKLQHDYELFPKDPDAQTNKKGKPEFKDIKAHIVITSYESIIDKDVMSSLKSVPWQGLIVDEGQRLKSEQNLIYEALSKLRLSFKVLMTGTPLQNNARELFNLLQFLDRAKHNAAELEKKYAELTQENVPELHDMLKPYFLRRTKIQVLTFLPPMAQIIVPVTMSALQREVSKSIMSQNPSLMKSIFSRDGNVAIKERANLNNILMQLRKTLCHPFVYSREIEDRSLDTDATFGTLVEASSKLQLLSIMLPKLKERGHRVLLFSQFLDNLDIVEDFLDGLGMLHRRLDGTISTLEKQKRIDEFNAPDSPYFAFLLSTRAGGVGINLATADTVIILDPDFNPHQDIQALSRAHRIGQQNKVLVFQLMTRSSAEEKIMQIGKRKMALDHVLIEAMDQDDDAGMDLESILRHGAAALFDDDAKDDIIYNEASIDKLLDRSQIESTKASETQSAESQFSFARIWANEKATLEEGLKEDSGTSTPNPDIWDKILKERQTAFEEEQARRVQELGRGKRRRGNVDYGGKPAGDVDLDDSPVKNRPDGEMQSDDDEFQEPEQAPETDVDVTTAAEETESEIQFVKARPFKRVKVPTGQAPAFNGDVPLDFVQVPVPAPHKCMACKEDHPMGWCRLKIAGVEHCGLCGLAHMGHGRTCPHLSDEQQVETLLRTLKESTESKELIDEAVKYLRVIRGDLVSQRRARERRIQQEREAREQAQQKHDGSVGNVPPSGFFSQPPLVKSNGIVMNLPVHSASGSVSIGANSGDYRPPQEQQRARDGA